MAKVLIVGNITKDVYLRLDNRLNKFEQDQNGVSWLDIPFNHSSRKYYSRASIYGGASISLEVLSRFGLDAQIVNTPARFIDGQFFANESQIDYRYILCHDEEISFITPSTYRESSWTNPISAPDWIYIDRSANVTPNLGAKIMEYLTLNTKTRLAIFVNKRSNQNAKYMRNLLQRSSLIITDTKLNFPAKNPVTITDKYIIFQGRRIPAPLNVNSKDLLTRLSINLTVAATIFGAILKGKTVSRCLMLARKNVEESRLGSTSNLSKLDQEILDEDYLIEKIERHEEKKTMTEIEENAKKILAAGKGILAADESGGSIHKKFENMGVPDDEQHRRDYRNLFFTTRDIEQFVSGVILFDETARQHADDGKDFITYLRDKGIIAGIKVDQGLVNFENSDEKYTQGLEGLPERLKEYYDMGARFAKWRAAFELTDHSPSDMAIRKNAEILAQYALDCQNANIVPIVEPELVYDGDYTLQQNIDTTSKILDVLFEELSKKAIDLSGCILKVNMVLAGKKQAIQSTPQEVGKATADVLKQHVPEKLAGVVFLSGGQSVEQATENLQEVTNNGPFPWPVTFSYARALQDPALNAWKGDNANADAAREGFRERLVANTEALKKK
jgi:fructose-bisphosphate aldolase class I